jgi:class 3 adenylate cyclase
MARPGIAELASSAATSDIEHLIRVVSEAATGLPRCIARRGMASSVAMAGSETRKLAAILAADIAGYSALMGADEVRTVRDLKARQAIVLPMIGEFGGRIVDTAGDGILAEFASVVNAVECAIALQAKMAECNDAVEPHRRMRFRIGINLGDVICDDARIYGDGINVAARLETIAEPGGICISSKVYDEVNGRINLICDDLGEQQLKNIARLVRVYRLRIAGTAVHASSAADSAPSAALHAASRSSPSPGDPVTGKSDQLAAPQLLPLRIFMTYAIAPIIILLLAHYVILVKLDLNDIYLRIVSLLLPMVVGGLLFRHTGYGLGAACLLGASIGLVSVLGMLVVVGMIDSASIVPSSRFEWQEAVEYALGIPLATMLGNMLGRIAGTVLSAIRSR